MKGFSLLELLIVLSLLILVGGFGYLTLFGTNQERELSNAKLSVAAVLREAQQRSINQVEGAAWGVKIEMADNSYCLAKASALSDCFSGSVALRSSLEFSASTDIVFSQVEGFLVSGSDCSEDVTINIMAVDNNEQKEEIKINCDGVITF